MDQLRRDGMLCICHQDVPFIQMFQGILFILFLTSSFPPYHTDWTAMRSLAQITLGIGFRAATFFAKWIQLGFGFG
jgi:hypothetical protein